MVFRYISSKLKQINSHILFCPLWLMHLLLSGQEFAEKKTNKQTNDNKEIIRFFYHIALFILFSMFEAFRIQVAGQSKLKKKTKQNIKKKQKQKQKRENKLYRILRSFFQVTMLTFLWSNCSSKVILLTGNCCGQHNSRNSNAIGEITQNQMFISLSECIIRFTVFTAGCVAIVTVNLLSIILFIKNKSLRTRSMYLVMSLTVVDLLVGGLSGSVYQLYNDNIYCHLVKLSSVSSKVLLLLERLSFFFPLVSLTNIAVISLERFHATFRPFRHRLIKRWVYVIGITVVWVFPLIVLVIWGVELLDLIGFHLYILESYCLLCLIVIFVSYTSILFKFRFGAHPQRHCAAALRQRKLTVTLFITTLLSLLLWLPFNILVFLSWSTDILNSLSFQEHFNLNRSLIVLLGTNSLVNPILYTIRMPDFKKALLALFRRHRRENIAIPLNRY